jgi:hypothetical protein
MKVTIETKQMVVLDDVLPKDHFETVWQYTQDETYAMPHADRWIKVWRLNDAIPMGGPEYKRGEGDTVPFGNAMDLMVAYLVEITKLYPEHMSNPYNSVVLRSYLYPRGTKLSWHDDSNYAAAMVFYTHKQWSPSWGGELFVEETPNTGVGCYVQPLPNRLVLTKSPILHQINRVDPDAGENIRSSIVAFFRNS